MKIKQKVRFSPIKITLETKKEAQLFFDMIDKVDGYHCNAGGDYKLTKEEYQIIIQLSNALTECTCIVSGTEDEP